jgi:outer membrane scaffolding protein for murein synthesis (MipA/OmpV family)
MPDGSRDMYAGLGVQSAPRWDGTGSRKVSALPVLQVQWSNGLFISGMSAGMHLSDDPTFEYGPLLAVQPGRDRTGTGQALDGVGSVGTTLIGPVPDPIEKHALRGTDLDGMDKIGARLQGGVFANYYVTPQWRLTSSLLYGAGNDHDGARLDLGVQRLAVELGARHHVSLSAGATVVNRNYNQTYFGVTLAEVSRSRFSYYEAGGGLQDAHVGVRWNWAWSPSWMLTTNLQARRLLGSAARSPLVERSTNLTVSTAIAYRF